MIPDPYEPLHMKQSLLPIGTRVRNKRTDEMATVVEPTPYTREGEICLIYDDDHPDQKWNQNLTSVEVVS